MQLIKWLIYYDLLIHENPDIYNSKETVHNLNVFLSRLLFCFFAEDTEIFDKESIFTDTLAQHTLENGSDTHSFLNRLFESLNTEDVKDFPEHFAKFEYVNGGLFKDPISTPMFSAKARKILIGLGGLQWKYINPDIFGSMIQAVVLPEYRSDLGMHYTSVDNIKKLIQPLFLEELKELFEKYQNNAAQLRKLIQRIAQIKFFDPACGSGNFLIITYKELRLLEIRIIQQITALEKIGLFTDAFTTSVSLNQFYGIELDDFAHEMAILSLWLAEHQMNRVFDEMLEGYGASKPILPLKESGKIVQGDAARISWGEVCPKAKDDEIYIIGNPPYAGARTQNGMEKSNMDFVFHSFKKYRDLDYISIWFYKATKYIEGFNAKYAFVSTNSICQGQQVALLWPNIIGNGIEIEFAYLSFKWTNNAKGNAGVTVIILGLRNFTTQSKYIFEGNTKRGVKNISPYLRDELDIFIPERITPISKFPKMNFGNMPNDGGGLILLEEEKNQLTNQHPDTVKFLRILLGSEEYINGKQRYCLWLDENNLENAIKIPFIQKRIESVKKHRLESKDAGTNKLAKRSHQFRDRNEPKESQFIIPAASSDNRDYIPCGYLDKNFIVSNSAMVIYDGEPFLFAVINSKMHMVWVKAVGGKLKTDPRYSAKLCYNTFPFPNLTLKQKENLNLYVFAILDERAKYAEKTMAWMYNRGTMPEGLKQAHEELDKAVEQCYRLQSFTSDTERLEYLFKLYEEITKKDTLFARQKKTRKIKSKE